MLVRHGETGWNKVRRYQGHIDIPLGEAGLAQSEAVAQALANQRWDALYSSDLLRAMQTAQAIEAATGLQPVPDARLRERHLGVLQGLTYNEFASRHPEALRQFYSDDADWIVPGGESQRQAFDRVSSACAEIAEAHAGGRVLVVTHGGCLGYMLKWVLGLPPQSRRRWSCFNCGLHTFVCNNGEWRLVNWGDVRHLSEMTAMDGVSL